MAIVGQIRVDATAYGSSHVSVVFPAWHCTACSVCLVSQTAFILTNCEWLIIDILLLLLPEPEPTVVSTRPWDGARTVTVGCVQKKTPNTL